MDISEAWIIQQGFQASAIKNGKSIFTQKKFTHLYRSEDQTFYMGECQGSGSSIYTTSVDMVKEEQPVFRCTCPSRQFPCKHAIGLLYAMMKQEDFGIIEIPEDILNKRNRLAKREERVDTEDTKSEKKPKRSTTATTKRFQKQLDGLHVAEQFIKDILQMGLAAFVNSNIKSYQTIVEQMGDYYLPGVQKEFKCFLYDALQCQKTADYAPLINRLTFVHTILKKGTILLQKKIAKETLDEMDLVMEEYLGHIWKLQELEELHYVKEHRSLIQLGFRVSYIEALSEYVEEGFWFVVEDGEIHKTINTRPKKALKYIKEEDSVLDCIMVPRLYEYPGLYHKRIRYEGCLVREITQQELRKVKEVALSSLSEAIKLAKTKCKHPLETQDIALLLAYDAIECHEDSYYICKGEEKCKLFALPGYHLDMLRQLPEQSLLTKQTALVLFSYEKQTQRLFARLVCLISDEHIVRMLY